MIDKEISMLICILNCITDILIQLSGLDFVICQTICPVAEGYSIITPENQISYEN